MSGTMPDTQEICMIPALTGPGVEWRRGILNTRSHIIHIIVCNEYHDVCYRKNIQGALRRHEDHHM